MGFHTTAVTHKYPNWKMIKEVKHRKLVKEYAFERININAMRKNKILPAELKVLCPSLFYFYVLCVCACACLV